MTQIPPPSTGNADKKHPTPLDQKTMDALYRVFQMFALEDQRKYYHSSVRRYRKAADQVNHYRAIFALIAGLASAAAGLIVGVSATAANCRLDFVSASTASQTAPALTAEPAAIAPADTSGTAPGAAETGTPAWCFNTRALVFALVILAIVAPAIAAAFGTLSDIYQWDRLINVYESALENLEVADAQSPLPEMEELVYRASLRAYAEGTLSVMRDETAQWGQLPKPPERLETFINEERQKAAQFQGSADDLNVDHPTAAPPDATG